MPGHRSGEHTAYPDADEQVEVYSPDIAAGVQLVKSDQIQPVE